jgi:tetratricopeptide (TPR) repeat protein
MAATPKKNSPSSHPVQQSGTVVEHGAAVDPPGAHAKEMPQHLSTKAPPATPNDTCRQLQQDLQYEGHQEQEVAVASAVFQVQPTYESSEQSEYFLAAKQLLADGDFEQALVTIQEGLETTKAFLETSAAMVGVDLSPEVIDLHESLAPLHYLYGTTLLYSVEESTDSQQMTVGAGGCQDTTVGEEPDAEAEGSGERQSGKVIDDFADDMQIAWENLDAAKTIVEIMLEGQDATTMPFVRRTTLQMGLAQILLREGDLQRLNGRYIEAIADYEACLNLRQTLLQHQDPFSRQIADVHYNLGLTYLTSSSDLKKQLSTTDEASNSNDSRTNDAADPSLDAATRDRLSEEHRINGVYHYLECAKVFCGRIAISCCADPHEIITGIRIDEEGVPRAGLKTTGLDDDHQETKSTSKESLELSSMRRRVAGLTPVTPGDSSVLDLRQFLDEIQEAVDEAAASQEAVRQASELRVKAQEAVAGAVETDSSGVTMQIGFGAPTMTTVAGVIEEAAPAVVASGNGNAKPAARPMMVIKKKKRQEPSSTSTEESSKPLDLESSDTAVAKRAKIETPVMELSLGGSNVQVS